MKKIVVLSGDPNSINSEIIYKVWKKLNKRVKKKIFLISNYDLLVNQFKRLKLPIKLIKVDSINSKIKTNNLKIINIKLTFKDPFNIKKNSASKFFINSLNYAHKNCLKGNFKGFVNCPIDKNILNKRGVTEFLASKCFLKDNSEVMLIKNKNFAVSPITTHIKIKSISKSISKNKIIIKVKTIDRWYKKYLNIKPKIAILGLNPHNAEFDSNSEEKKIIVPALKELIKKNININGPFSSDTFFIEDYKKYDVAVGMFHDQVITPFKTLFKFDAINVTLGLRYLRISPDHGVAKNIIGKNKANYSSLLSCVNFLDKF